MEHLTDRQKKLATIGIFFGIFLAAIESTVVATAMPTAIGALGSIALIHYVFASFQLATTGTIVIWGKLADTWGLRRTYFLGCFCFLLGSALCGIADNIYQLIAFRFIQGVGAGAIYPVAQTTLGILYTEVKRAKMQVYLSLAWGIASVIGPPLGALVTQHFSWRWVFYLNLPAGFVSLALVHIGLRNIKEEKIPGEKKSFDWIGSLLLSAAVVTLMAAISVDRHGQFLWSLPVILAFLGAAGAILIGFAFHVNNTANPFLSPQILNNGILMRTGMGSFFMCMAVFGTIAFIPLYCQKGLQETVAGAGKTLTFFLFGWIISSALSARAYLKFSLRALARFGMTFMTLAFFYLGFNLHGVSLFSFRLSLLAIGIGMGTLFAPILLGVQSSLARSEMGSGTASLQLLRNLGGVFGVSILGTLLVMDLNSSFPFLGSGFHENPQLAMTRVFLVDSILSLIALAIFWNLPAVTRKETKPA